MLGLFNRLNYGKDVNYLLHLIVNFSHLLFKFSLFKSNPFISVKKYTVHVYCIAMSKYNLHLIPLAISYTYLTNIDSLFVTKYVIS